MHTELELSQDKYIKDLEKMIFDHNEDQRLMMETIINLQDRIKSLEQELQEKCPSSN